MDLNTLNCKITLGWVILGLFLLLLNIYKKNILFKVIGMACLVTSITAIIITTIFSYYPQYYYVKIAVLILLGLVIYFSISRITKINQIPEKTNTVTNDDSSEEITSSEETEQL